MKRYMEELLAVVGGSRAGNGMAAGKIGARHGDNGGNAAAAGHSVKKGIDKILPYTAKKDKAPAAPAGKTPEAKPEQVIPLGKGDFKEF